MHRLNGMIHVALGQSFLTERISSLRQSDRSESRENGLAAFRVDGKSSLSRSRRRTAMR